MTDNTQWQSPESAGAPTPPPAPPTHPVPPGQGTLPPRQWQGQLAGAGQPVWTPPPRPGLIPLRPLEVGTIIGAPFRMLRRNPRPTFGASLLVQLAVQIVTVVVVAGVGVLAFQRVSFDVDTPENSQLIAGAFAITLLSAAVPALLGVVAVGIMQAILVLEVSRETLSEKLRFAELWRRGRGRILAVGGYQLLVGVVVLVGVALFAALITGIIVGGGASGSAIAVGVAVGLLGALGIAVVLVWIGTKLAFVPSIMMLERLTMGRAIRRSWQLTRGAFWKVFGITLLVTVILNIASSIASAPLQFIAPLAATLFAPTGDQSGAIGVVIVVGVVSVALSLAVGAISLVVQSSATALLYLDQRIRKEGLDLELTRFVEARQSGAELPDPYLPSPYLPSPYPPSAPSSGAAGPA